MLEGRNATGRVKGATSIGPRHDAIAFSMAVLWALGAWQSNEFGIWSAVGGTAVLLGIAAVLLEGPELRAALGFSLPALAVGLAVGLAMTVVTYMLFPPMTAAFTDLERGVARLYAAVGTISPTRTLLALPFVVACEEIVWRGVVFGAFAERLSGPLAMLAATALYAFAHVPIGSPVLFLACLGAGLCWTALRWRTGSLIAVYVAHLVWDVILLFYRPLVVA